MKSKNLKFMGKMVKDRIEEKLKKINEYLEIAKK